MVFARCRNRPTPAPPASAGRLTRPELSYLDILLPASPHQGWESATDKVLGLDHGIAAAARKPEVDTLVLPGLEAFEPDAELGLQ